MPKSQCLHLYLAFPKVQSFTVWLPGFQGSHIGVNSDLPTVSVCLCLECSQKNRSHSSSPCYSYRCWSADTAFLLRFAASPTVEILPHASLFCRSLISLLKARGLLVTFKFVPSSLMSHVLHHSLYEAK